MTYLISILIPTLIERREVFNHLIDNIHKQIKENNNEYYYSSLDKLNQIYDICHELGVLTGCTAIVNENDNDQPLLYIVPLESWYDGSLTIKECEDLCQDFKKCSVSM